MTGQDLVFILLAVAGGIAAVTVVTARNVIYAAAALAATLASTAGVFLVLHADFVALVQIIIYVGAVAVLFMFGLMLTRAPIGRETLDSQSRALGLGVSLALFGVLAALIVQAFKDVDTPTIVGTPIAGIGEALFSTWVLPFELISMLLLAALVGAIALSRREEGESGEHLEAIAPELAAEGGDQTAAEERVAIPAGGSGEEVGR
ncbi:MAG: NADH-quinone oxidoreductase subunit J [Actinobacteria bacterium]|nr:NADH-quinone oxidoreductase subunit J [Actinomycetota bacterium]